MSRSETTVMGSVPLHTLEADVDYGFVPCFTTYGVVGVKVWIFRGLFGEQEAQAAPPESSDARPARPRRRKSRGPARGTVGGPTEAPVATTEPVTPPESKPETLVPTEIAKPEATGEESKDK